MLRSKGINLCVARAVDSSFACPYYTWPKFERWQDRIKEIEEKQMELEATKAYVDKRQSNMYVSREADGSS